MILAAGFGTRLRPLSNKRPKPLMPVANKPVILRNMEYLRAHGVREIIVNAHHHAEQVLEFLAGEPLPGVKVEVRVEAEILGTGGGIRNTSDFWGHDPFIVLNGDILTDLDLAGAYEQHLEKRPLATLILHDQPPYNKIVVRGDRITEIPKEYRSAGLAFTGIHIMEPEILSYVPEGFSDIVDCYRRLLTAGERIGSHVSRGHNWIDIGSIPEYIRANKDLSQSPFIKGPGTEQDPSARWSDWAVIGEDCRIGENSQICRSILWDGVRIGAGVKVTDCVVTTGAVLEEDCTGMVI